MAIFNTQDKSFEASVYSGRVGLPRALRWHPPRRGRLVPPVHAALTAPTVFCAPPPTSSAPSHALLFQYFLQVLMLKTLLFQYFLEVVFATTLTYGKHTRIDSHIGQQCRTAHSGKLIWFFFHKEKEARQHQTLIETTRTMTLKMRKVSTLWDYHLPLSFCLFSTWTQYSHQPNELNQLNPKGGLKWVNLQNW